MHVYHVEPVSKTHLRKTYFCASEDVLLLIINDIHNLSFSFSGKIMLCKINVVIFATQCGVVNFVPPYLSQKKGQSRIQLILVYFGK